MKYMVPSRDIIMGPPMQANQMWEVRVPVSIGKIDDLGEALHAAYTRLQPGDQVNVTAFESNLFATLTEVASFRVVSKDIRTRTMRVALIGEVFSVPPPMKDPEADQHDFGSLRVVADGTAWLVTDVVGNHIETFVEREQAVEFAKREGGRPNADPDKLSVVQGFGHFKVTDADGNEIAQFPKKAEAEEFAAKGKAAALESA